MTPASIGRYRIERELGRGGTATAYLAHDPYMKRAVVVKVLLREYLGDSEFMERFRREAEVVAALEHPYIVPVYDFGEHDQQPFIVMRYMAGGSLRERLGPHIEFSPRDIAAIIQRVAEALEEAHSQNIVHRDLKPANLLLDARGQVYLADFGIAKMTSRPQQMTMTGVVMGTPEYMSPEQALGQKEVDKRTDVYSLGVILFQLLTGDMPYKADTSMGVALAHITSPIPDVLALRPTLNPAWQMVINQALAKAPEARFASALALAEAVKQAALAPQTALAPSSAPPKPTTAPLSPPTRIQKLTRGTGPLGQGAPLPVPAIGTHPLAPAAPPVTGTPPGRPAPGALNRAAPQPALPRRWPRQLGVVRLTPDNAAQLHAQAMWGKGAINALAFTPDGSFIAAGVAVGVYVLQAASLTEAWFAHATTPLLCVAFSADKRWLAAGGADHAVWLWEATSGQPVRVVRGHLDRVLSVAFHPTEPWLAAGCADGAIRIFDLNNGLTRHTLAGHTKAVHSLAFSPDGNWLASGGHEGNVNVWNAATGQAVRALNFLSVHPPQVIFSSASQPYVLGTFDNTARLWDGLTGDLLQMFEKFPGQVTALSFNADWSRVITSHDDGQLRVWDVASGRLVRAVEAHTGPVTALAAHPANLDNAVFSAGADGALNVANALTGVRLRRALDFYPQALAVAAHPQERLLAVAYGDGAIRLVDWTTGRQLRVLAGHTAPVTRLAFTGMGGKRVLLASAGGDATARWWDTNVTQALNTVKLAGRALGLAVSADGQWLAVSLETGPVQVIETRSGQARFTVSGPKAPCAALAFSPDGRWLAGAGQDFDAYLWETRSGKLYRRLEGHAQPLTAVAFSPDGRWLATAGDDALIGIWDNATGQRVARLEGHLGGITDLAFCQHAPYILASAGRDHAVRLWQVQTRTVLTTLLGHNDAVHRVTFSPDGQLVFSAGADGVALVWGAGQAVP